MTAEEEARLHAEAEANRLKRFEQGQAQRRRANKKRGIHVRKNRAE